MIQVGEIRKTLLPFYDARSGRMLNKSRPSLILGQADTNDYVILPISRITRQENRNLEYDIRVVPQQYPLLGLTAISYIRTHKQTVVHCAEIADVIGVLKGNYNDLFSLVLERNQKFNTEMIQQART